MDYDNGFILQKMVDWSLLNDGMTIPVSVCSLFRAWDESILTHGQRHEYALHRAQNLFPKDNTDKIDRDIQDYNTFKIQLMAFNKFIVFDEAHKYMNNKELVGSITTAIREMRHKGVSIMIASQDPMSLPTEIIELSSIVVMHRFSSPAWVKHVQKAITPLQTLTATEMAALGSGEAYLWANKSSDKAITQRPIKISIRPRVTKHGGDIIQAVK